jgi:hypothetical protein
MNILDAAQDEQSPAPWRNEYIKVSGLRVYINPAGAELSDELGVFYSRREGGPFYRWSYDKAAGRWRSSRVEPSVSAIKALSVANWKIVPPALRARLDEHYLE